MESMRPNCRRYVRACLLFLVVLVAGLPFETVPARGKEILPAQEPSPLRAGAAASNITPWLGEPIVGGWESPPAEHIHDELYARCLVLEEGKTRLALVLVDNVGVPQEVFDEAKRLASAKTGIPPERMLMAATHTHSATSARGASALVVGTPLDEYQRFLARRIADGIRRAVHHLEPARIGWGVGREPSQVFNRRWRMKPGTPLPNPFGGTDQVLMNSGLGRSDLLEPAGPVDPEVVFLSIQARDGRPIALLANYSLHYVGGTGPRHVSADYFGFFADRIQQLLGADRQDPPFVGILSNGTSGDINNINFRGPRESLPPYEKMRRVANILAAEVFKVYQTIQHRDHLSLDMAQSRLRLQTRRPTEAQLQRARQILNQPETAPQGHPRERIYAERTLQMAEFPEEVDLILQAIRIGEVGIAAIPAEVFVEIGLEIKGKSPFKPTFTISLANGAYGYLPTVEHHRLGGYETWLGTNRLEVEAAPKIVRTLLQLFQQLQ